jgi:hypothetical protein
LPAPSRPDDPARLRQIVERLAEPENVAIEIAGAVEIGDRDRHEIDAFEQFHAVCLLESSASPPGGGLPPGAADTI